MGNGQTREPPPPTPAPLRQLYGEVIATGAPTPYRVVFDAARRQLLTVAREEGAFVLTRHPSTHPRALPSCTVTHRYGYPGDARDLVDFVVSEDGGLVVAFVGGGGGCVLRRLRALDLAETLRRATFPATERASFAPYDADGRLGVLVQSEPRRQGTSLIDLATLVTYVGGVSQSNEVYRLGVVGALPQESRILLANFASSLDLYNVFPLLPGDPDDEDPDGIVAKPWEVPTHMSGADFFMALTSTARDGAIYARCAPTCLELSTDTVYLPLVVARAEGFVLTLHSIGNEIVPEDEADDEAPAFGAFEWARAVTAGSEHDNGTRLTSNVGPRMDNNLPEEDAVISYYNPAAGCLILFAPGGQRVTIPLARVAWRDSIYGDLPRVFRSEVRALALLRCIGVPADTRADALTVESIASNVTASHSAEMKEIVNMNGNFTMAQSLVVSGDAASVLVGATAREMLCALPNEIFEALVAALWELWQTEWSSNFSPTTLK